MESEICNLYKSGNSLSDIAKKLSISKSMAYRCLKKNNIDTKKNSSHYIKKLYDYEIDDSFFEKIDTEEKAYILGFLYADGNLHKKNYHIKLKLQERDKYILEAMNIALKSNKPLYFHKKIKKEHQNQFSIVISNKKMYNDVIKIGLYPDKTYDLRFKKVFDDKLYSHFLRGYFDGDGCICVYNNRPKYMSKKTGLEKEYNRQMGEVSFTGTKLMCIWLKDFLLKNLKIESHINDNKKHDSRITNLKITTQHGIFKFYEFLYKDAHIFLERKKEKFNKLKFISNERDFC